MKFAELGGRKMTDWLRWAIDWTKWFLCSKGIHSWNYTYLLHHEIDHIIMNVRKCKRCGIMQGEHAGLLGDGKWHDLNNNRNSEFENESIKKTIKAWKVFSYD